MRVIVPPSAQGSRQRKKPSTTSRTNAPMSAALPTPPTVAEPKLRTSSSTMPRAAPIGMECHQRRGASLMRRYGGAPATPPAAPHARASAPRLSPSPRSGSAPCPTCRTSPASPVVVLRELNVEGLAMHARHDQADARPRVEPAMEQAQLRLAGRELSEAECGDETRVAQSITSSARVSNDGGIVMPRAFAVLRFTKRSNFVGCSIGRSPGFVPFRILST